MKVAILGHGVIGGGVSRIILEDLKYTLELKAICDIKPELDIDFYKNHKNLFKSFEEIINDKEIDIVCETIGGGGIALDFVKQALKKGKHVVTANKKMIALHIEELLKLSEENNVHLLFEAAIGGGIPIISTIKNGLSGDKIESITGILNGTTNYILTSMEKNKMSFDDALKEAQNLGYAEQDPTDDIENFDSVYKLKILIALVFGKNIDPDLITRFGMSNLTQYDIEYAKKINKKIKVLAKAYKSGEKIFAEVSPVFISTEKRIAKIDGVINAVEIKGKYNTVGNFISGEGAGRFPTAAAICSDLLSINNKTAYKINNLEQCNDLEKEENSYYVRFFVKEKIGIIAKISKVFAENNISIKTLDQTVLKNNDVYFSVTTIKTTRKNIEESIKEISKMDFNIEKPIFLPII